MKQNLRQQFLKVFGPSLAEAKIRKIEKSEDEFKIYIRRDELKIPQSWKRHRQDAYYVLHCQDKIKIRSEFSWLSPQDRESLDNEGNLIHDYGFLDLDFQQPSDKVQRVYFNTARGFLEISAQRIFFEI